MPEEELVPSNKLLCFANEHGKAELWVRYTNQHDEPYWYSPLREIWANLKIIEKLERRLEVQQIKERRTNSELNKMFNKQSGGGRTK